MRLNKVILSVISYIVVGSFQIVVWGQTISGKIIDSEQRPIEGGNHCIANGRLYLYRCVDIKR